jgi:hypothetical protein
LIERLLSFFHGEGLKVVAVTNGLVTLEDAERVQASRLVDPELVAPYVGEELDLMRQDVKVLRLGKLTLFTYLG